MKLKYILSILVIIALFFTGYSQPQAITFNYTGSVQTWTVPPCVFTINVIVAGAKGGEQMVAVAHEFLPLSTLHQVKCLIFMLAGWVHKEMLQEDGMVAELVLHLTMVMSHIPLGVVVEPATYELEAFP